MARTMTDKQERDLRDKASRLHDWPTFGLATQRIFMDLLAELDAERAAHKETTAEANFAHFEVAALKARLALAEALDTAVANFLSPQRLGCTLEELREGVVQMAHTQPDARSAADALALIDALAAWRAAK